MNIDTNTTTPEHELFEESLPGSRKRRRSVKSLPSSESGSFPISSVDDKLHRGIASFAPQQKRK